MMNKKTKQLCGGKGQKRYGNYQNVKGQHQGAKSAMSYEVIGSDCFKAITVSPPDARPLSAEEEQSCGLSGQQCFWRPVLCFPAETLCTQYAKWVRSQASQPPGWAVLVMTNEEFVEKFGESAIRSMLSSLKENSVPTIHWSQVVACGGKLS
jgi:hypothetical protein